MAGHQLTAIHGEAVRVIGLVDLLRERLQQLQPEHERRQRSADEGGCGAADGCGVQQADADENADMRTSRPAGNRSSPCLRCYTPVVNDATPPRRSASHGRAWVYSWLS